MDDAKLARVVQWLQWLAVSLVGLAGLALAAAHAPARIRLLLLLSVLFGAIAGWGMALAARQLGLSVNRASLAAVALLVAGALVGQTLEAWRVNVQRRKTDYIEKAKATALVRVQLDEFLEEEMADEWRFDTYLQSRLAVLKQKVNAEDEWPVSIAIAFWLFEVLAGGAAAAWVFRRSLRAVP